MNFHCASEQILYDVNLVIQPGIIVTIMDPNGAGKSTIARLILGFYRPQDGCLYADGHPESRLGSTSGKGNRTRPAGGTPTEDSETQSSVDQP